MSRSDAADEPTARVIPPDDFRDRAKVVWMTANGAGGFLTADQADDLATQLRIAATEGRRLLADQTSGR